LVLFIFEIRATACYERTVQVVKQQVTYCNSRSRLQKVDSNDDVCPSLPFPSIKHFYLNFSSGRVIKQMTE